jgi:hypothetical protein
VDIVLALVAAVAGLLMVDIAAIRWGADSRDPISDDHRR